LDGLPVSDVMGLAGDRHEAFSGDTTVKKAELAVLGDMQSKGLRHD
jgi:hypothetical protein